MGACAGELLSETLARGTGQTGWNKVGVKAFGKTLILGLFYLISTRMGGLGSLFFEVAGYSSMGSIFFDLFAQVFPGGIWGLAERWALSLRGAAFGAERVAAELEIVETGATTAKAVASTY